MEIQKLVEKSTRQYEAIRENLDRMAILLREGQTADLLRLQQEYRELNEEARETDHRLNLLIETGNLAPEGMEYKRQVMLQVKEQSQKLLQQARTLQALTAEELLRLKNGRKALGGYRSSNRGSHHSTLGSC